MDVGMNLKRLELRDEYRVIMRLRSKTRTCGVIAIDERRKGIYM